ncbi:MAG: DUF433 domain-containing protein, partial [Caldilineaceae bacterium]|nr:DUF433 domain-containing protein [Caldilineaceae bacterium]
HSAYNGDMEVIFMVTQRIEIRSGVLGGKPCVRGTRIPVTMVLELIAHGIPFAQIVQDYYPQLSVEDIQACVEYERMV